MAWAKLGTITVTNGKLTISMSAAGADGDIVADGILLTVGSMEGSMSMVGGPGAVGNGASSTPIGPIDPATSPATETGGGKARGAMNPAPGADAGSITVASASDPETVAGSTAPSSTSLTDQAIDAIVRHHRRKHRGANHQRIARSRPGNYRPNADGQHPRET